eukprot:5036001-Amphidinium_carterae.1
MVGIAAAGFNNVEATALQVVALTSHRHGMAFALLMRRLKNVRSSYTHTIADMVAEFLKINNLGIGAFATAVRRLPLSEKNLVIRRLGAIFTMQGYNTIGLGLEANLVRL